MMAGIKALLAAWFSLEPAASLMMVIAAFLLFGVTFNRIRRNEFLLKSPILSIVLSFIYGILFIAIVGIFYTLLKDTYLTFTPLAWSLASGEEYQMEVEKANKDWGAIFVQNDLTVIQETSHVEVKQLFGPKGESLYINETVIETLDQESILGFEGNVKIHVVDQRLNTYTLDAVYEYDVANQSEIDTIAKFQFPIGMNRTFRNLVVSMDEKDVGGQKEIQNGVVSWQKELQPGQHVRVRVSYLVQGREAFTYRIPNKRPINSFFLAITVDSKDIYQITNPDTVTIEKEGKFLGKEYTQTWKIDKSIFAPEFGLKLKPKVPTDPRQEYIIQLVRFMPRGLMLLAITVLFTLMVFSVSVDLWRFSLLSAVFSSVFLALMGVDLMGLNHFMVLPSISLLALFLIFKIYQKMPHLPLVLILCSTAIFLIGYPHAGLLQEESARNAFDSITQASIILYIFVLAFYNRIRRNSNEL